MAEKEQGIRSMPGILDIQAERGFDLRGESRVLGFSTREGGFR